MEIESELIQKVSGRKSSSETRYEKQKTFFRALFEQSREERQDQFEGIKRVKWSTEVGLAKDDSRGRSCAKQRKEPVRGTTKLEKTTTRERTGNRKLAAEPRRENYIIEV